MVGPKLVVVSSLSHVQLLYDSMDCRLPGSSVHEISQARILEWVAISFSRGFSWPRNQIHVSWLVGGFFTTEPPGILVLRWRWGQKLRKLSVISQILTIWGWMLQELFFDTPLTPNNLTLYKFDLQRADWLSGLVSVESGLVSWACCYRCGWVFCFYLWPGHCPLSLSFESCNASYMFVWMKLSDNFPLDFSYTLHVLWERVSLRNPIVAVVLCYQDPSSGWEDLCS